MAYTSHGHHIKTTSTQVVTPFVRESCGGPRICRSCFKEAMAFDSFRETLEPKSASGDILKMASTVIDEDDTREHYVQQAEEHIRFANEDDYASVARTQNIAIAQVYATLATAYRGS